MPRTSSAWDLELQLADGSWLGLMLEPERDSSGTPIVGAPRTVGSALQAVASETPLREDLVARVQEDWSRGVGLDYDAAYAVYTRTPGYALPAGAATQVQVPINGNDSNSPLVAYAEYNGDLYVLQQGTATSPRYGRVLKLAGGSGVPSQEMALGVAGVPVFGASFFGRDLLVADDGAGNVVLYASFSDADGRNGVLYRRDAAGTWTNSTSAFGSFGAVGLNRLASVYWKTADGIGAWRIVAISGPRTFSYTLPNVDPRDHAQWVTDIRVGTTGQLLELAAFRRHVFFAGTDNVYDVNELGESAGLTSYLPKMLQPGASFARGAGYAVETLNGYIYLAVGRGLIRLYTGDVGALSEDPIEGHCAPGWATAAEHPGRGVVTALGIDQGYVVAAVYEPSQKVSRIYWGIDRRVLGIESPNPLIWYGPEVTIDSDWRVTRLVTSSLAGDLRLWIASQSAGGTPRLDWVSLPVAGSPIQDLASGGSHRFAPGLGPGSTLQSLCRLELLLDSGGDKARERILYQYAVGSRGLDAPSSTRIRLYARADPDPGSGSGWGIQGPDITSGPVAEVTPTTPVSGHKTQLAVELVSPQGAAASPSDVKVAMLDSIRTLSFDIAPALAVSTLEVTYGDGVPNTFGTEDTERSPDWKSARLKALTEARQTQLRDRNDQRWTVKVRQVMDGTETLMDDGHWGKRVTTRLQLSILAGPL